MENEGEFIQDTSPSLQDPAPKNGPHLEVLRVLKTTIMVKRCRMSIFLGPLTIQVIQDGWILMALISSADILH